MRKICPKHLNLFMIDAQSLRRESELLTHLSHHVLSIVWRKRLSNIDDLYESSLVNDHVPEPRDNTYLWSITGYHIGVTDAPDWRVPRDPCACKKILYPKYDNDEKQLPMPMMVRSFLGSQGYIPASGHKTVVGSITWTKQDATLMLSTLQLLLETVGLTSFFSTWGSLY